MPQNKIPRFTVGDEVTLTGGINIRQLNEWKDKKAIITEIFDNGLSVEIRSKNNYSNSYSIKDLKIIKQDKKTIEKLKKQRENEKIIKQFSRKKGNTLVNHISIYCIKNYNFKIK